MERICSRLRNGWRRARLRFYRQSGRKVLADAAFHLTFRTEYTPDDEEAIQVIFERLF
jgi:hypothetical protein